MRKTALVVVCMASFVANVEAMPESPEAAIASARTACQGQIDVSVSDCINQRRINAAFMLDQGTAVAPRLVGRCEALHPDPIAAFWCFVDGLQKQKEALQ